MTAEGLPDGPDPDEMIQLIRLACPEAVVATIDSAAFFSLDDKHWPNFATVVWTDEHDEGTPEPGHGGPKGRDNDLLGREGLSSSGLGEHGYTQEGV
jgi:hypothetical protein